MDKEKQINNYYQILRVSPRADLKTIKAAYRTLMFKHRIHPDLGGTVEGARKVNEAYQALSDPEKRRLYNLTLDPEIFKPQQKGLGSIERRRIPRVNVNFNVTYRTENNDSSSASVLDLSFLGCRLQTTDLINVGTKLAINIGGHTVEGIVRWKRMFHPSIFQRVYESGIEFDREFDELDEIM